MIKSPFSQTFVALGVPIRNWHFNASGAAFEARRGGGAIIAATMSPEIIAVLQDWAPDGVLVGPASAILLQPEEQVAPAPVVTGGLPQIEATAPAAPAAPQTSAGAVDDENVTIGDEDE